MADIMYIQVSPRDRSKSTAVAEAFVTAYKQYNPNDNVETVNIFELDLPPFDGPALQAKYNIMHGNESTPNEKAAWAGVEHLIHQFKAADKYVLSIPMWNFGIPYRLKQYFDVIVQPGYTFNFDHETGYEGLVKDKPVFIAYARGGDYTTPEMASLDFQQTYMNTILGFIGLTDITDVIVQPTLQGGPEVAAEKLRLAIEQAQKIAAEF